MENMVHVGIFVIKRINHGLWLKMIFILLIVHFLSPCKSLGIKKHNSLDENHIQSQTKGDLINVKKNLKLLSQLTMVGSMHVFSSSTSKGSGGCLSLALCISETNVCSPRTPVVYLDNISPATSVLCNL
jgi:predicted transglutaminase-like protease